MADDHSAGHPAMDYAEHERTYEMFVGMTKWGTILMVALMIFMAVTLL
ncbi:MAG: Bacterial aa3 type cytochrome c oxidase subunit [Hyphomicrobiales bacterium]|nr:Bacterial aa3 type cytochrome c oxidase subunit [Hyphomicrobiales bacterium]